VRRIAPLVPPRQTRQRDAIRAALAAAGRPLSPQELLAAARAATPGLGLATVYRTVKSMLADGTIHAVELPAAPARYELAGKHHHHHFHCRACDRVYELEGCPEGLRHLTPPGFALESHELVLYGRCAGCAA
jgi:Fur family transcriptional regulator, ferric uptake regulator